LVADLGVPVLLLATIASGAAARTSGHPGRVSAFTATAGALSLLLVAAYVVAIWAMTTKPD
jgi:hypothetical protein